MSALVWWDTSGTLHGSVPPPGVDGLDFRAIVH